MGFMKLVIVGRFESLHPTTEGHSEAGTNNQSEADKPRTRKRRNRKHKMKNCKRVSKVSEDCET